MFKMFEVLVALLAITAVSGDNCDKLGTLLYQDLGCSPVYNPLNPCPIKYQCEGLWNTTNNCEFKGKFYEINETIDSNLTGNKCEPSCICGSRSKNRTRFFCAVYDCRWYGKPSEPTCYHKYSLDNCCPLELVCPPFSDTTCLYDGKEYKEGERFYPKDSCSQCVCQKGFNGNIREPFCKRTACNIQLKPSANSNVKKFCAPVYNNNIRCCPDNWICPDGSEVFHGNASSGDFCKFGDKVVKVGEKFERADVEISNGVKVAKVQCECVIPPLLTCTTHDS